MSYKQLPLAEHHDGIAGESSRAGRAQPEEKQSERWFLRSADAYHTAISVAAGTVMALFGYEQGVFGGCIVGEDFLEYFDQPTPAMQGFVTSVYDLGCFGGALLTLFVGEKLGRKRMLIIFTVIMGVGIVMQTGCQNMTQMVWGRLIAGIGNGGNTATAPVWHVSTATFHRYPTDVLTLPCDRSRHLIRAQKARQWSRRWLSTSWGSFYRTLSLSLSVA